MKMIFLLWFNFIAVANGHFGNTFDKHEIGRVGQPYTYKVDREWNKLSQSSNIKDKQNPVFFLKDLTEASPQWYFSVTSNNTEFRARVPVKKSYWTPSFKLNLVVENMTWGDPIGNTSSPHLSIFGVRNCKTEYGEVVKAKSMSSCSIVEYGNIDKFNSIIGINDLKEIHLKPGGDWTASEVSIVITLYHDGGSDCSKCRSESYFCCCKKLAHLTKCIRKYTATGESLLCNKHPNCGYQCQDDESSETCPERPSGQHAKCSGTQCFNMTSNIASRLAVIFLAGFVLPSLVIMLICSFPVVRKFFRVIFEAILTSLVYGCSCIRPRNSMPCRRSDEVAQSSVDHQRQMPFVISGREIQDDPPPSYEECMKASSELTLYSRTEPTTYTDTRCSICGTENYSYVDT